MTTPGRRAALKVQLQVLINGIEFEAVQFASTMGLNEIPRCSITLAVGISMRKLQPATAHSRLGLLMNRSPVEVYLHVEVMHTEGGLPTFWPREPFLIFEGFVTGTSWQRGAGAYFTVHAEHWLSELNYSSAISGASHPGNPSAFTYSAGYIPLEVSEAGGSTGAHWVPHISLEGGVTREMAEDDMWERVLKPWMIKVSEQDPIDLRLTGGEDPGGNRAALAALARMRSENMGMRLDGVNSLSIGNAIAWALQKSLGTNVMHTTLWGKLVGEWSPDFFFSIVPRVSDALVVPFAGALGPNQYWAEIKVGDYVHCDMTSDCSQIIRALAIHYPVEWRAGGNTNVATVATDKGGLVGVYPPNPGRKGVVMMKAAPSWLADVSQGYAYAIASEGVQPRAIVNTTCTPANSGSPPDLSREPGTGQDEFRGVLQRFAHHWYVLEQLNGRMGEISGRLRFDIAPGSQVRVEAGLNRFGGGVADDQLAVPFYASVVKVTHVINADTQKAGTAFTLAHIRNEAENSNPDTVVETPPLYRTGWRGRSMIDEFAPGQ